MCFCFCSELEELELQKQQEEEFIKQKEARKEGLRNRKPVFTAQEKSEEELKGYSKLNLESAAGTGVRAVQSKVSAARTTNSHTQHTFYRSKQSLLLSP